MDIYGWHNRPEEIECQQSFPEYESTMETTGYEELSKTIDRAMVAGMRLYDTNRNMNIDEIYEKDEQRPEFMEKYKDEQDVKMRYREIWQRLKRKAGARASAVSPSEGPAPIIPKEPEV